MKYKLIIISESVKFQNLKLYYFIYYNYYSPLLVKNIIKFIIFSKILNSAQERIIKKLLSAEIALKISGSYKFRVFISSSAVVNNFLLALN